MIGASGSSAFFDGSFVKHADLEHDRRARSAAYLDEWSQPGAMTAMLNWYRASAIVVPAMDETPERPALLDAPLPAAHAADAGDLGHAATRRCCRSQLEGLDALVPDLTIVQVEDAGHFVPWEKPEAVNAAMREWLA